MTRTITRLFDTHTQALDAVEDLERAGVDRDRISVVSNNADNWHAGDWRVGRSFAGGPLRDADTTGDNDVAEGAGKGATTGGLIGGGAGLLAGLGMLAIPGLGPVVAAGWLASTAVGALVSVKADETRASEIERVLNGRRGVDAVTRGRAYRETGWSAFDPGAAPFTAEEVARERSLYPAEDRSFAAGDVDSSLVEDDSERLRRERPATGLGPSNL